jgi:hypothetical protein
MKKNIFFTMVTVLAITLVGGCGSGGGGSTPVSFSATSTGAVVDGIVKHALVVANELDASGNVIRQVGSATTDDNGEYSITIDASYTGGPLDFVLTGDATTTMVCDVLTGCGQRNDSISDPNGNSTVDFGEEMNVNGLKMDAIIGKANAGDTLSVNITPYTTAAAKRARTRAGSSLDAAAVNAANSAISNLLGGLDIIALKPLDLTNPQALAAAGVTKAQITYAVLASAIGKLAFAASGNANTDSLSAGLNKLADSVAGDNINASASGATYSLQEIVNAALAQFPAAGQPDQTGVLTQLQNQITTATAAGGNGLVAVMANANAGDPDITKAKMLVQEIRTWGVSLTNPGGAADTFGTHIDAAGKIVDPLMTTLGNSLYGALDIMMFTYQMNQGIDGTYPYDYSSTGGGKGTVTIANSGGNSTLALNGTVYTETVDNLGITFTTPTTTPLSSLTVGISGKISTPGTSSGGASLSINTGTANVNFDQAYDLSSVLIGVGPGSAAIVSTGFKISATVAQTGVADPVSFSGTIELNDAVHVGTAPNDDFVPTSVKLSGSLSDNADMVQTTINGSLDNPGDFDPANPDSVNLLTGTLSVSVTVQLANLPQAQLTGTANRTGFDSSKGLDLGTLKVILSSGDGQTITANASRDATKEISTTTFKNTAGAQLTLSYANAQADGALTVGTKTVATVTDLGFGISKINYIDGTFETFE